MSLTLELYDSAEDGNLDRVCALLQRGANVNGLDDFGRTALMAASMFGHDDVVRVLLAQDGVDLNIKAPCGQTAYSLALLQENKEVKTD